MIPEKLINWGGLSRTLSGSRSVVTKNRKPKKHEKAVNDLIQAINKWYLDLNTNTPD